MGATNRQSDSNESRQQRRERYETLLRVLALQTTDVQGPAARRHSIKHNLAMQGYAADKIDSTIRAAREQNDVWSFVGPDGVARLALMTKDDLRRVIEWLVEMEHPHKELIGRANGKLKEVEDGEHC